MKKKKNKSDAVVRFRYAVGITMLHRDDKQDRITTALGIYTARNVDEARGMAMFDAKLQHPGKLVIHTTELAIVV